LLVISLFVNVYPQKNLLNEGEKQQKILLSLAQTLYAEKEYMQVIPILNDFADLYPESHFLIRAMEILAVTYEKVQMFDKALVTYEKLYQISGLTGNGLDYYYNQARILYIMGDEKKSNKIYNDIINLSPDSHIARKAKINQDLSTLFQ